MRILCCNLQTISQTSTLAECYLFVEGKNTLGGMPNAIATICDPTPKSPA